MFDYLNSRGWDDNDFKVLLFSKSAGNSSPPVTARQRIKKCAGGEVDLNLWLAPPLHMGTALSHQNLLLFNELVVCTE